jgi:hypothetical protein
LADTLKQMKIYSIYVGDTLGQVSPIVFLDTKRQRAGVQNGGTPHPPPKKREKKSVHVVGGRGGRGVYLYASA